MRALITSDLHFTDRRLDEYRWNLFEWIKKRAEAYRCDYLLVGGDITDKKDRHPARLVNRMLREFADLAEYFEGIYIIKGNHDYVDPKDAFFYEALNNVDGVEFISDLAFRTLGDTKVALVPHTDQHRTDWREKKKPFPEWEEIDLALFHLTFKNSKASNGMKMDGLGQKHLWRTLRVPDSATIVAGDIHVPQSVGRVTYVGSPYPIAFGDSFKPRVLIYDSEERKLISKRRETIKKAVVEIEEPEEILESDLSAGDMVRVFLSIPRSRIAEWPTLRGLVLHNCIKMGVYCRDVRLREKKIRLPRLEKAPVKFGGSKKLDHSEVLKKYSAKQKLGESVRDVGVSLLEDSK